MLSHCGMALRASFDAGFLKVEEHSAKDAAPDATAIGRLRANAFDVLIVHDVVAPQALAVLRDRLESNAADFEMTEFPGPFRSFFYGRNLNLNAPELDDYFTAEPLFRAAITRLGEGLSLDLIAQTSQVLSSFDQGRRYRAAAGRTAGEQHFFATLRGHLDGGYIPAHFDNEQSLRPSYRHIAGQIRSDIFSYVLTLAAAEQGGQLELFNLRASDHAGEFRNADGGRGTLDLTTVEKVALPIPAGSMVLVNSGRLLHQVSRVQGARKRWTMCSFMALSATPDEVLCWG
jgi:hypothetical protein